jgi:tyrosyl-tRNA synthetase
MKREFLPVDEQLARLSRGAVDLVSEADLRKKLERSRSTGKPISVKTGFDPSSPDLHLGHVVLLRKMRQFQELGHRVIFVVGDFTGLIGDPTGKKATRPQLSQAEVDANAETYKRQMFRVLDRDETVVVPNSRWLRPMGAEGMIRLAGKWTLARMLEREDFKTRFRTEKPISLHELLYPLVQAKDSVEMAKLPELGCDVELGGHDQIFNLLVGRDLMKEEGQEPQCVLTVPLLVGLDGHEKMSKSLGNAIAVEDPPKEMYGKTLSIPDTLMWDWMLLLTDLPAAAIDERKREVGAGRLHPKLVKQELARTIVEMFHGRESALRAEEEFERIFGGGGGRGGVPDEIGEVRLGPRPLASLLVDAGLAPSKNEARRLLEQGAVTIDGERAADASAELPARGEPYLFKVGKRRFLRVAVG